MTDIQKKVLQKEFESWLPIQKFFSKRDPKTRSVEADVLEFLFKNIYQRVQEEDLLNYLTSLKQGIKDKNVVSNSISRAVRVLRGIDNGFELLKIKNQDDEKSFKLKFNEVETVLSKKRFSELFQYMLQGEKQLCIQRTSIYPRYCSNADEFSDLGQEYDTFLRDNVCYSIINDIQRVYNYENESNYSNIKNRFFFAPESAAIQNFILFYEDKKLNMPFMGVLSNNATAPHIDDAEYVIIRHVNNQTGEVLRYLQSTWEYSRRNALTFSEMEQLIERSKILQKEIEPFVEGITKHEIVHMLMIRKIKEKNSRQ